MAETMNIAFLGPYGTYSHLVAKKYFGKTGAYAPQPTVLDVCSFVSKTQGSAGIIPIENSSGGAIYETVDILLANKPRIHLARELSLNVRLALLGYPEEKIRVLYSHFAPLEHCAPWVKRHLPGVTRKVVTSTAVAAERAAMERHSASLGSRELAKIYNLKILHFPVAADIPNITSFLVITHTKPRSQEGTKTMIAARLHNRPGSLFSFLEAFKSEDVNLSRLISRPIRGCPREYVFLVDVDGGTQCSQVQRAIRAARKTCVQLRVAGSFGVHRPYKS